MADETTPPTQTEILEQQKLLVTQLGVQVGTISKFLNNDAATPVVTESGQIPSLRGLIEEIRQRAGARRYEVNWSGEDLTRYAAEAEPLLRCIHTTGLYLPAALDGSYFRLATPTGQPVTLEVQWGADHKFTVTFAANSDTGVVTSDAYTDGVIPAGTMVTVKLKGSAWTAAGLAIVMVALVDNPAAE